MEYRIKDPALVNNRRAGPGKKATGFTLQELCIVIILMAILATFTVPRFYMVTEINLRTSTRRLAETLRLISTKATSTSRPYLVKLDLDKKKYCYAAGTFDPILGREIFHINEKATTVVGANPETRTKCFDLKEGVYFKDIEPLTESGQLQEKGEMSYTYSPRGITQPMLIRLGDKKGRFYTLVLSRYGGNVEIRPGRIEYKDYIKELLE